MKTTNTFCMILASVFMGTIVLSQGNGGPVNYLNTPTTLSFNNASYVLSWTSHPNNAYYKQEYIVKGESVEHYTSMLMLEVLTSNVTIKDVVLNKTKELEKTKAGNPYVTYESGKGVENGEQILDFTLTANSANGKEISIAERNVYRYVPYKNSKGEKGLLLLAISVRAYGADCKKFLAASKIDRSGLVNKIKAFKLPAVTIK